MRYTVEMVTSTGDDMRMIDAVKIIRAHTGAGLIEAKKAADEIVEKGCLAAPHPENVEQAMRAMDRKIETLQREVNMLRNKAARDARSLSALGETVRLLTESD